MNIREQADTKILEVLNDASQGLRFTDLFEQVRSQLPDLNENSVIGAINSIASRKPNDVVRPSRGLYLHAKFYHGVAADDEVDPPTPLAASGAKEEDFYEPFAEWLVGELEECTKAISVGGKTFGQKWGTPDVIGKRESKKSDIVPFPTEIVSAEIKLDTQGLITAFGQACAYRLFSHKSYLVVPSDSPNTDVARLDSLSRIFGLGLILFDRSNKANPAFDIRVRAISNPPDMFYVNQNLSLIEDELFG